MDVEWAAGGGAAGAFAGAGQAAVAGETLDALAAHARRLRVGPGIDPGRSAGR